MALHNIDLQKMQAMMMINMKLRGMGNLEIAKAMNISKDTVERRLAFANKAGLFVELERQILDDLVPAAMKAIKTALEDGDAETAMELFKSMGIIPDPKAPKTQVQIQESDDLQKAISEARDQKQLMEGTVDATIINGRGSLAGLLESSNPRDDEATEETVIEDRDSVDARDAGSAPETA